MANTVSFQVIVAALLVGLPSFVLLLMFLVLGAALKEIYNEKYAQLTRRSEGLVARWLLRDTHDPDALFVLSHWDSLESMHSWEESEYFRSVFLPSIQPMLAGEFTVSVCEVSHFDEGTGDEAHEGIVR